MLQSLIRFMTIIAFGSFSAIAARTMERVILHGNVWSDSFVATSIIQLCIVVIATGAIYFALKKLAPFIDSSAQKQAKFLDTLNVKYTDAAIIFSAAVSLFLELGIIRWQSSIIPFLAFYKNYSLMACFAGLGLGYALATRDRIPLLIVLPLLAWQFSFMTIFRYGFDNGITINPI